MGTFLEKLEKLDKFEIIILCRGIVALSSTVTLMGNLTTNGPIIMDCVDNTTVSHLILNGSLSTPSILLQHGSTLQSLSSPTTPSFISSNIINTVYFIVSPSSPRLLQVVFLRSL